MTATNPDEGITSQTINGSYIVWDRANLQAWVQCDHPIDLHKSK